jgi:hypothetical protein
MRVVLPWIFLPGLPHENAGCSSLDLNPALTITALAERAMSFIPPPSA